MFYKPMSLFQSLYLSLSESLFRFPFPVSDLGHIQTVFSDVIAVLDQFILHFLFQVSHFIAQIRQPVQNIPYQMKTIHIVQYRHIKSIGNRTFFLIAPFMNIPFHPHCFGSSNLYGRNRGS
jgi:hypothetical protein